MNILMRHVRYSARKILETVDYNITDEQISRCNGLSELIQDTYGRISEMTDEELDAWSLKDTVLGWLGVVPISWIIRFICGISNLFY